MACELDTGRLVSQIDMVLENVERLAIQFLGSSVEDLQIQGVLLATLPVGQELAERSFEQGRPAAAVPEQPIDLREQILRKCY